MTTLRFSERDRDLFRHLGRYRITTPEIVTERFCKGSRTAATKLLGRLRKGGYLRSVKLPRGRVCDQLTEEGAAEAGVPLSFADALGPQALPRLYAVLMHCNASPERELYTRDEFSKLPGLKALGTARTFGTREYYCLERRNDVTRLTRIVIDYGRDDPASLLRKCIKHLYNARQVPALLQMIRQQRYAVTILTLQDDKRRAIEELAGGNHYRLSVPLYVHVVELLSELIQGIRT